MAREESMQNTRMRRAAEREAELLRFEIWVSIEVKVDRKREEEERRIQLRVAVRKEQVGGCFMLALTCRTKSAACFSSKL